MSGSYDKDMNAYRFMTRRIIDKKFDGIERKIARLAERHKELNALVIQHMEWVNKVK